jgi:membrane-bound lytic murein transglycosylase MltF
MLSNVLQVLKRTAIVILITMCTPGLAQAKHPDAAQRTLRALVIANNPWIGDFQQMVQRRLIRVLVPYSRTLFFNDKGRERGLTAEFVRDFERYLNQKHRKQLGKRPITVVIISTTRDKLLSDVAAGLGDIAAGNLTITQGRLEVVDFVPLDTQKRVSELLVTGPRLPTLDTLDDLAGKNVHVRRASSYYDSLEILNARFTAAGKPPMTLTLVPDALEDEDMLEMLNAGLFEAIVVDDWKAKMWAQILPQISLHGEVVLRSGGQIGWAFRQGSPQLAVAITDFFQTYAKKQGIIEYRLAQYHKAIRQIQDPTDTEEWQRFQQILALFERYGHQYAFEPLMLAAQGYQESQLRQEAKSHVGAIGIMQLMPATGREMNVGDIKLAEANIHAGTKYLDQLMTRFFPDAQFSEYDRPLFAFASYNAGPGNIARMRKEAAGRGLNPDMWFNHVELVTAEKIGFETTTYVRNIYKYYVAYKLTLEAQELQRRAREQLAPALQ